MIHHVRLDEERHLKVTDPDPFTIVSSLSSILERFFEN
jgi:hypothetical protein